MCRYEDNIKMDLNTFAPKNLMIAEFLTYQLLHNKCDNKTLFEKQDCNHLHVPTYKQKLHKIKVTNYPYTLTLLHFSGINRHPQGDINPKPYISLKHQIRGVAIKKPDSCSNTLLKKNQTIEMLSPSM